MFEQILDLVKEHLGKNPQVSSAIPPGQADAVHNEIASHVTTGLASQAVAQGGVGGLLSKLQDAISSGSPVTNAIEGGLVGSLGSKFGLSPMITGAIAAALPGGTRMPVTPSSITSGSPPAPVPITGNSAAIASSAAIPRGSMSDGWT